MRCTYFYFFSFFCLKIDSGSVLRWSRIAGFRCCIVFFYTRTQCGASLFFALQHSRVYHTTTPFFNFLFCFFETISTISMRIVDDDRGGTKVGGQGYRFDTMTERKGRIGVWKDAISFRIWLFLLWGWSSP